MSPGIELRRSPRYTVDFLVPYAYVPAAAKTIKGDIARAMDLSEGGAGLDLPEVLEAGTLLSLRLPQNGSHFAVEATVVWIGRPSPPGAPTRHGVAFPTLTVDQRAALGHFFQPAGVG